MRESLIRLTILAAELVDGDSGGTAELVDGDDDSAGRPRRRQCGAGGKPAASGCTDGGAGQDGRRRREAGRAAARPPTLALGGRDAGEEGGYDGLKAPSGGRFCFSQEVGRTCKPFGCSVQAERLGLSLQQESAQPGLLAHPNRPIRDPRNRQVFKPLV